MDKVPTWLIEVFQRLPDSTQRNLQLVAIKSMQDEYFLPVASVLSAYLMCYIPHSVALGCKAVVDKTEYNNDTPRNENPAKYSPTFLRAVGAHYNSLEMFPAFAVGVLLAISRKVDSKALTKHCAAYIKLRAIYVVLYLFGINKLVNLGRTVAWAMSLRQVVELYSLSLA